MADQTVATSSLRRQGGALPNQAAARTGFTHKFEIDFSDINDPTFTTDGDTVTVTLGNTPERFAVLAAVGQIVTAFATDGTLTVMAGIDGDPDAFITAKDAKTDAVHLQAVGGVIATATGTSGIASDVLVARFTTQGATGAPADITAGRYELYLKLLDLAELNEG